MTIYYVYSGATGAANGTSWTDAWTTLGAAITAVTTAGDVIYLASDHSEALTASTTYAVGSNHVYEKPLKIYSVNRTSGVYEPGALIGSQSTSYSISISSSATGLCVYGVTFRTSGSSNVPLNLSGSSAVRGNVKYVDCTFKLLTTSAIAVVSVGIAGGGIGGGLTEFLKCDFVFGNAAQYILPSGRCAYFYGCTFCATGTVVTSLFKPSGVMSDIRLIGCDVVGSTNLVAYSTATQEINVAASECNLPSNITLAYFTARASGSVEIRDCHSGDTHINYAYSDYFGTLSIDTGVYCNDNVSGNLSWKVYPSAYATRHTPFITPWISAYHSGTSAITPYLELVRSGNANAFTESEVWSECAYKDTSGSTRATIVSDGAAVLSAGTTAQTSSSKSGADWTGENATSWFGKIGPSASITPQEVGDLSFRICAAVNESFYVDPQIRGLS